MIIETETKQNSDGSPEQLGVAIHYDCVGRTLVASVRKPHLVHGLLQGGIDLPAQALLVYGIVSVPLDSELKLWQEEVDLKHDPRQFKAMIVQSFDVLVKSQFWSLGLVPGSKKGYK